MARNPAIPDNAFRKTFKKHNGNRVFEGFIDNSSDNDDPKDPVVDAYAPRPETIEKLNTFVRKSPDSHTPNADDLTPTADAHVSMVDAGELFDIFHSIDIHAINAVTDAMDPASTPVPESRREALNGPEVAEWEAAYEQETNSLEVNET